MPATPPDDKTIVTLQQIGDAVEPKVSAKTVSLALRGDAAVSKQLAAQIQAKALDLGYVPRRSRDGAFGLIVPYFAHLIYAELVGALRSLVASRGMILLCGESTGHLDVERRLLAEFSRRGVDGVILISPRMSPLDIDNFSRLQQPIVSVFMPVTVAGDYFGSVEINNEAGAQGAVEYLLQQGHRRIVYLAGRQTSASDNQRRRGYGQALAQAQVLYEKSLVVEIGAGVTLPWPSFEAGYVQGRQILERRLEPDAILAYNDMLAIGAMKALHEQGLRVPQDVSIVGFDNTTFSQFCAPTLTTVGVQRDTIASLVIDLLFRLVAPEGGTARLGERHHRLDPDLIYRQSVQCRATR